MSNTAEELKDTLNDIERDVYDGIDLGDMFTKAYVLADELGESIDKLREENAKLRDALESCAILLTNKDFFHWPELMEETLKCMRELGVEVE